MVDVIEDKSARTRSVLSWITWGYLALLGLCSAAVFTVLRETRFLDIAGPMAVQCTVCFIASWALFLSSPRRASRLFERWAGLARRSGRNVRGVASGVVSELGSTVAAITGLAFLALAALGLLMLAVVTLIGMATRFGG